FVQGQVGCGPCYDPRAGTRGVAYLCPRACCMEQISADEVWRAARRACSPTSPFASGARA
ncbi:MAG: hypothetical protein ACRD1E_03585, partial [Terriglobales bacterium]